MMNEELKARIERVREAAAGQWLRILTEAGIPHEYLENPNRPCPLCGGRDRFTFFKKESGGGWFCRGCGHGDGIALLQRWRHEGFIRTLEYLEAVLALPSVSMQESGKKRYQNSAAQTETSRQKIERFWEEAIPINRLTATDPVLCYLKQRHLLRRETLAITELRSHPLLDYWENDLGNVWRHERWPALLARVSDDKGRMVSLHRTYLTQEGLKAPVSAQKKLAVSYGDNGLIRLFAAGEVLGVAEGIETALAAHWLFKVPVWSAICANGFAHFSVLPDRVKKLIVFGDNDESFTGQAAAWGLAKTMRSRYPHLEIEVKIPSQAGDDWHDIFCRLGDKKDCLTGK